MATNENSELQITRLIAAPRHLVWQAWSDPQLLKEWWCPQPWTTEVLAFDLRPGGAFHTLMRGPDGGTSDNPGCFLEVVEAQRLVFTSAMTADYRPADKPWMPMTAIITMSDEAGGTRYTARVLHDTEDTKNRHLQLGFYEGWGICIDQLAAFALTLALH